MLLIVIKNIYTYHENEMLDFFPRNAQYRLLYRTHFVCVSFAIKICSQYDVCEREKARVVEESE